MIAVIGENIVDMVAQPNGSSQQYLGGSPFNVAIGLGKLEQSCCYLSPLSQDIYGDQFLAYMQQHNVTYGLPIRSPYNSSVAQVTLDEKGHAEYNIARQNVADRDMSAQLIIDALPDNMRILHTGSLALEPDDLFNLLPVIHAAKQRNIKISVDLNVRMDVVSDPVAYLRGIQQLLPLCNYIKASDDDVLAVYPKLDREDALAQIVASMDDGIFAFTEGEFGASLITPTQKVFLPAIKPSIVGDTIGAGDTFYAAFLTSILNANIDQSPATDITPQNLHDMLHSAIVAASINVSRYGCVPPTKIELEDKILQLEHVEMLKAEIEEMMLQQKHSGNQ